jgi:hypothetical protein
MLTPGLELHFTPCLSSSANANNCFKARYLLHPNSAYVLCFVFHKSTPQCILSLTQVCLLSDLEFNAMQ